MKENNNGNDTNVGSIENSIEEDMKILEGIIKGDEDCINAIYSQMKVKNDNDEDIQYYKKEIQSIKNIVDNYLKEKARADKLEKEYSAMLTESDENECDYKRVLKENEYMHNELDKQQATINKYAKENEEWQKAYQEEKDKQFDLSREIKELETQYLLQKDLINSNDYISKQKIKDKIEELNKVYSAEELEDILWRKNYTITELVQYVLQELLKESEDSKDDEG